MSVGLVLTALGFALFTRLDGATSFLAFAFATTIFSLGLAPVFTLTTDLVVGSAPPERAGAASAISETSAELGGALGIALFGSLGVAIYRSALGAEVLAGVPANEADAARSTLAGALTVANGLPDTVARALGSSAEAAFLDGLRICAWVSTFGALALAVFAWRALRVPESGAPGSATSDRAASGRAA
jgi:DHA2 family multidrug resistance protein-like MFS transporter